MMTDLRSWLKLARFQYDVSVIGASAHQRIGACRGRIWPLPVHWW